MLSTAAYIATLYVIAINVIIYSTAIDTHNTIPLFEVESNWLLGQN